DAAIRRPFDQGDRSGTRRNRGHDSTGLDDCPGLVVPPPGRNRRVSQPDWSEIEEVMAAALELGEEERTTYLAWRCSNQPELRSEVESLLAADERAGAFLQMSTCPFQPVPGQPVSLAGRHIGSYQLLDVVGRGGMGTVYLAERTDGRFHKQVAIKV